MNFVEFPDIVPFSMDFVPPRFPISSDTSLGGVSVRRKFGNRQYDGRLILEFRNITNFMCAQVLLTCVNSKGLAPIEFKDSFFQGAGDDLKLFLDGSAYPGLLWYFIEDSPPRINRAEGGAELSNMSLELAARLTPDLTGGSTVPILPTPLPGGGGGAGVPEGLYVTGVGALAPLSSTGGTSPILSISLATQGAPGAMSSGDKTKLDNIEVGAQPNVPTDLGYVASARLLESSTGTDVILPLFSNTTAGLTPASGGGTTKFLRADGTWIAPPGGGGLPAQFVLNILYESISITNTITAATVPLVNPTQITNFNANGLAFDEGHVEVSIGFDVLVFGAVYNSVFINSNSYFTFGGITDDYGYNSYQEWLLGIGFSGVFIGSDDGGLQLIKSTGPLGTVGQRTNTIRFQGSASYTVSDPNLSDVIWEITFRENNPSKIFLRIIAFNPEGGVEGVDFFTFSGYAGNALTSNSSARIAQFVCQAGAQYELTLGLSRQIAVEPV